MFSDNMVVQNRVILFDKTGILEISYKNKFFSNIYSKLTMKLCENGEYKDFVFKGNTLNKLKKYV